MSKFDWSECPDVERDPSGATALSRSKALAVCVSSVLANIGYLGIDNVVYQYGIPREKIEAVMHFLVESCEPEEIP